MRVYLLFSAILLVTFHSCENPSNPWKVKRDYQFPNVEVTNLESNRVVAGIVEIKCQASDDVGIYRVELIVDGVPTGSFDEKAPYILSWDTRSYKKDSHHNIIVKVIDLFSHVAYSDTLILIVNNSSNPPTIPTDICDITYNRTQIIIKWHKTQAPMFAYYELFHSLSFYGQKNSLAIKSSVIDTTQGLTGLDPNQMNWFWIAIMDTLGYQVTGSGHLFRNFPPASSTIFPILYQENTFTVEWSKNTDDDFLAYELYESTSSQMEQAQLLYRTEDKSDTVFIVQNIPNDEFRYYQVKTIDFGNLIAPSVPRGASSYLRIVYKMYQSYKYELYIMDIEGQDKLRLANNSVSNHNPDFSPDGSKIVYDASISGNRDIYMMNIIGKDRKRLTSANGDDTRPQFSNDGSKIVYTSKRDGNYEIYIMNNDGSDQRRLTIHDEADVDPVFSYDDSKIVFISYRDSVTNLFLIDLDTFDEIQLTNNDVYDIVDVKYSPLEDKVIYVSSDAAGPLIKMDLHILDIPTMTSQNLTDMESDVLNHEPVFTLDGQNIIYLSNNDIYMIDIYGQNKRQIASEISDMDGPDISYDGKFIVFLSYKYGGEDIFTINLDDLQWNRLTDGGFPKINIKFQRRR